MDEGLGAEAKRAKARGERIRLGVSTSLMSKVVSLGVQVIALPVAVRALGSERYGVYLVLAALLGWIGLAGVGINPSVALGIAEAAARSDRRREKRIVATAMVLMSGIALIACTAVVLVALFMPGTWLFGQKYGAFAADLARGLVVGGVCLAGSLVVAVVEAAQLGYQELFLTNIWRMLGNGGSLASLLIVAWLRPSVLGLIISVYGVPMMARAANLLWFLRVRRPYLWPRLREYDREVVSGLFGTGLAFLAIGLSSFCNHELILFVTGRMVGPQRVASLGVMLQILLLLGSALAMYGQPLWAALADAGSVGDVSWTQRSYRQALGWPMIFAGLCGLVIAVGGHAAVGLWFGPEVTPNRPMQIGMGLYFVAASWESLHCMFLLGLQRVWQAAGVLAVKSAVVVALTSLLVPRVGASGAAGALLASSLLVGVWMFPLLVRGRIRELAGGAGQNGTCEV
ncbi:MAG: hypothetical protein M0000_11840 [Actinomycetota bacterium]|nr:hypothetical protein [Actinomycetota bacterium]